MNVITVSHEYGAGGAEVAGKIAQALGWELLDRELLHQAAAVEHVPDAELERLDEKEIGLLDRFRLHPPHERYLHGLTEAARQAAARGKVVLVGRGVRHLLGDLPDAFHLRLVAPPGWRAQRMARREGWSAEQAVERCTAMDRTRGRFTRYFFGAGAEEPWQYDAVVNTGRVALDAVADALCRLVQSETAGAAGPGQEGGRVLALTREVGARGTEVIPDLARRLGLRVCDRELMEEEARRLGVPLAELRAIDENPAGILQRLQPGSLYRRFVETMGPVMKGFAERGDALLVGRGGNRILSEDARAFHVRLVAPLAFRVRRVMHYHWMREASARQLIATNDGHRQRFFEQCFGGHWADPLEYHLTVNTRRPGMTELVALVASSHWATGAAGGGPR